MSAPIFQLGGVLPVVPPPGAELLPRAVPAHHFTTHGVVVGMTGSGKTGLVTVVVEEALRSQITVLVIDVKGDLPNLALCPTGFAPDELAPWVHGLGTPGSGELDSERAVRLAHERAQGLRDWGIDEAALAAYVGARSVRVITPGSNAGEPLHVLSSLERRSTRWDHDPEAARAALSAAISLVLRLLGKDPDPAKSREHVLLSVLAERRLAAGAPADLGALIADLTRRARSGGPRADAAALGHELHARPAHPRRAAAGDGRSEAQSSMLIRGQLTITPTAPKRPLGPRMSPFRLRSTISSKSV